MGIGDKVTVVGTGDVWEGKSGTIDDIVGDEALVRVDFGPNKTVMQNFPLDRLSEGGMIDGGDESGISESLLKENEGDMAKQITEMDWNGHHYEFENEFHSTGSMSHDVLIMKDESGNEWRGETTWINRPWHRFDLEEAWVEVVGKAFGKKAQETAREINKSCASVSEAIRSFFKELKPEDVSAHEESGSDHSTEARKAALAKYLGVKPEDIQDEGDDEFSCDDGTYRVLTDEEADEEFDSSVRSSWDGMGLESVSDYFKEWVLDNALNDDEYEDIVRGDYEEIVYGMDDSDVIEECREYGIVEEEEDADEGELDVGDLRERLIDRKVKDAIESESFGDYLRNTGYDDSYIGRYIDDEKVIEALKDDIVANGSGRGQEIAYYDGYEIDLDDDLYAYRVN